jgi:hypothetical protein
MSKRQLGYRLVASTVALWLGGGLGLGCGKMSTAECDKVRTDAFDIVNEAHTCDSDEDCVSTAWPGCSKPVSRKNGDRIKPIQEKFNAGKCEEPKLDCRPTPEIYCKQGLCVFRELAGG